MTTRPVHITGTISNTTGDYGRAAQDSGRLSAPAAVAGVREMFNRRRKSAVQQRARLMGRMVMLLTDSLCTNSYDQFIERYSNPGSVLDETARNARISQFEMRFSSTCWYDATASLYENAQPWILIEGGGDDCGVHISVRVPDDANVPSRPVVDLQVPRGAKRGHDAGAMVRALRDIPGWRGLAAT